MQGGYNLRNSLRNNAVAITFAAVGLASIAISTASRSAEGAAQTSAVERLVAIEDIQQLQARYYRCVDRKDWDCWRAIFASDFVFDTHSKYGVIHGPEGMIDLMHRNGLYDRVKTVHYGHMPEVEILSSTTARGTWTADYRHYYPLGQSYETTGDEVAAPGKSNHSYASYYETFVKRDGKWQMQTMEQRQWRTDDEGGITIPATK